MGVTKIEYSTQQQFYFFNMKPVAILFFQYEACSNCIFQYEACSNFFFNMRPAAILFFQHDASSKFIFPTWTPPAILFFQYQVLVWVQQPFYFLRRGRPKTNDFKIWTPTTNYLQAQLVNMKYISRKIPQFVDSKPPNLLVYGCYE